MPSVTMLIYNLLLYLYIGYHSNTAFVTMTTGDSTPHAMWEETQEIQMNYTQYLTTVLRNRIQDNVPVYPSIGNHGNHSVKLKCVITKLDY